jgi:hypothetical protein
VLRGRLGGVSASTNSKKSSCEFDRRVRTRYYIDLVALHSRRNEKFGRRGRVVEGTPLLREHLAKNWIEGSNPSVSASAVRKAPQGNLRGFLFAPATLIAFVRHPVCRSQFVTNSPTLSDVSIFFDLPSTTNLAHHLSFGK